MSADIKWGYRGWLTIVRKRLFDYAQVCEKVHDDILEQARFMQSTIVVLAMRNPGGVAKLAGTIQERYRRASDTYWMITPPELEKKTLDLVEIYSMLNKNKDAIFSATEQPE